MSPRVRFVPPQMRYRPGDVTPAYREFGWDVRDQNYHHAWAARMVAIRAQIGGKVRSYPGDVARMAVGREGALVYPQRK